MLISALSWADGLSTLGRRAGGPHGHTSIPLGGVTMRSDEAGGCKCKLFLSIHVEIPEITDLKEVLGGGSHPNPSTGLRFKITPK